MSLHKRRNEKALLKLFNDYLLSKVGKVRILGEANERDLKDVFVDLSISERTPIHENAALLGMMDAAMRERFDPFQWRTSRSSSRTLETKNKVKPAELLQHSTSGIITGAPGCGKTTLLKYLALRALKAGRFVIWLELKVIDKAFFNRAKEIATQKGHPILLELWIQHVRIHLQLSEAELRSLRNRWREMAKANELVLLLDGFDELQTKEIEDGLNRCISEFLSPFHENVIFLSTRPYALGRLGNERLREFELDPLNQHQIEAFLNCYYPKDAAVSGFVKNLRQRPALIELLRAPLLLGVGLRLYKEGIFTDERLKLYQAIVSYLVDELDRSKALTRPFNITDNRLRLDFLKFLAFELLLRDSLDSRKLEAQRIVFSYNVLKQKAQDFLTRERISHDPRALADDALATPLLLELGLDSFAFAHLTLEEYLAACHFAAFHNDQIEGLRIFCLAFHNPTIVEMEVLPMMLGALPKADCFYEELEKLPESLTFANFRLRARGLVYGANISESCLATFKERLAELLFEYRVESKPYIEVVGRSLTGAPQHYLTPVAEHLEQHLNHQFEYSRAKTTEMLGRIGGEKAATLLETALKDKVGYIRQKAAYWLGELGDPKSTAALIKALRDEDAEVVKAAARAVVNVNFKEGMEALIDLWQTGDTTSRSIAIYWLGIFGREVTLDVIEGILANEEGEVRLKAVEALGFIGGDRALSLLCDFKVCAASVTAIGQCGGKRAVDSLLDALRNPISHVRCAVIDALARIDAKRFTEVFITHLRDPDSFVRERAAVALEVAADRRAIPELLRALDYNSHLDLISSHRGGVVSAAAHALRHFKEEEIFQALLSLVQQHRGAHGTEGAVLALGRMADKRAVAPLLAVFDNARNIAWAAAEALGLLGDKDATIRLIQVLTGEDSIAKMRSAEALGRIRDERAVVPLLSALQDQFASEEASLALRKFDANVLAQELPKGLTHENPFVRRKAVSYIPYYSEDSGLLDVITEIARSDPDDLVRMASTEAVMGFTRKLDILGYASGTNCVPGDNESLEGILVGEVTKIVATAKHIFREITKYDEGIDAEIEFRNDEGRASGQRVYLQLKSGNSHLYVRKNDSKEIFRIKNRRHAQYWVNQPAPVILVIRDDAGQIRWMNVTDYLRRVGPNVYLVEFQGEPFNAQSVQEMRARFVQAATLINTASK